MKDYVEIEISENESAIKVLNVPKNFENNTYSYMYQNPIFKIFSNIVYYGIAYPILTIILKLVYDLKIEGKENIQKIEAGAVTVSNHVLILDCAMIGIACGRKKVCFTTQEESFEIPFVKNLIKLLNAIPIPKKIKEKKYFIEEVNKRLKNHKIVHFYPEASLIPYCSEIRNFKNGCFDFAVKNNVPVIPMVFIFREPKRIRKFFKRKKDVTLKIGEPIWGEEKEILKDNTYNKMKEILEESNKKIGH